ncbi:hypothetical protein N7532_003929 [Penicillium argentinense]|uniref:Uncharacterized protein n=1 Tax=Penicillium argentinense TaxID=1131581 RepID=A0A9W9FNV5_9EURO|nr:uncharacterized protein N7532_003929 [Penicillium argentinense]KAJ5103400.1 hypothetical protein N7532_003929 [Penicillium argentinense]
MDVLPRLAAFPYVGPSTCPPPRPSVHPPLLQHGHGGFDSPPILSPRPVDPAIFTASHDFSTEMVKGVVLWITPTSCCHAPSRAVWLDLAIPDVGHRDFRDSVRAYTATAT